MMASLQVRYLAWLVKYLPLMPLLFWQGREARRRIPRLPEAARSRQGRCGEGTAPFRLLLIGESTAAGVGVEDHRDGLAGQLACALQQQLSRPVSWTVCARSGYTARQAAAALAAEIPPGRAELIVIALGANDVFALHSPRRWQRDCRRLVEAIRQRQPDSPLLFSPLPPVGEFPALPPLLRTFFGGLVRLLEAGLRELVRELPQVYMLEDAISLAGWAEQLPEGVSPAMLYSDGVHPSALTYRIWGEALARYAISHIPLRS